MFRRWRVDAKPLLKRGKNILEITLYSPIKKIQPWLTQQPYALPGAYDSAFHDEPTARHSATYVRKAPYQFGWDWDRASSPPASGKTSPWTPGTPPASMTCTSPNNASTPTPHT